MSTLPYFDVCLQHLINHKVTLENLWATNDKLLPILEDPKFKDYHGICTHLNLLPWEVKELMFDSWPNRWSDSIYFPIYSDLATIYTSEQQFFRVKNMLNGSKYESWMSDYLNLRVDLASYVQKYIYEFAAALKKNHGD